MSPYNRKKLNGIQFNMLFPNVLINTLYEDRERAIRKCLLKHCYIRGRLRVFKEDISKKTTFI